MPLRDHFRPPVSKRASWEGLHGPWPAMIVQHLHLVLPDGYMAEPRVHLGPYFEIDETAFERAQPDQYEYEVLVFDQERERRVVAAVELVSPANKDRPESRRALVTRCAALLRQGVGIALVDLVTVRRFNLYAELLEWIGQHDPALGAEPPPIYAASLRFQKPAHRTRCKRGRIPWSSANRYRRCRCGCRRTAVYLWTWRRATRTLAACCGLPERRNREQPATVDGLPAPSLNDQYLFYQTLVGAWPDEPPRDGTLANFRRRMTDCLLKATKEAKVRTSWVNPNEE